MEVDKPFLSFSQEEKEAYRERMISFLAEPPFSLEEENRIEKNVFQRREDLEKAMDLLSLSSNEPLSVEQIVMLGNQVSESHPYISRGYRKRGNLLEETKTPIPDASEIQKLMEEVVSDYHNTWKDLDPFSKEAHFFLQMIRIHPFEDGNRRTAFLLVNHHLMKEGYAPIYLTGNIYSKYLECIQENQVDKMTELFESQSQKEAQFVLKHWNMNQKLRK